MAAPAVSWPESLLRRDVYVHLTQAVLRHRPENMEWNEGCYFHMTCTDTYVRRDRIFIPRSGRASRGQSRYSAGDISISSRLMTVTAFVVLAAGSTGQ